MSQKSTYVVLPPGTVVCQGSYNGVPSYVLRTPTLALIEESWDESFSILMLLNRDSETITTGLSAEYVLKPVGAFQGGQTKEEAWKNFDQSHT